MVAVESEGVLLRLESIEALAGLGLGLKLEIRELDEPELESESEEEEELKLHSVGEATFKVALDLDLDLDLDLNVDLDLVSACLAGTSESMDEKPEPSEDVDMAAFEAFWLLISSPSAFICLIERSKFFNIGSSKRLTAFKIVLV